MSKNYLKERLDHGLQENNKMTHNNNQLESRSYSMNLNLIVNEQNHSKELIDIQNNTDN